MIISPGVPQVLKGGSVWWITWFFCQTFPTFWRCFKSLCGYDYYLLEGSYSTTGNCVVVVMLNFIIFVLDYRSLKLMLAWLPLPNFLRKWKGCMWLSWILIQGCKMVGWQIHQLMDMQMILKLKQTLISIKCFLVSWPLMQWSKCLHGSKNLLWKGIMFVSSCKIILCLFQNIWSVIIYLLWAEMHNVCHTLLMSVWTHMHIIMFSLIQSIF